MGRSNIPPQNGSPLSFRFLTVGCVLLTLLGSSACGGTDADEPPDSPDCFLRSILAQGIDRNLSLGPRDGCGAGFNNPDGLRRLDWGGVGEQGPGLQFTIHLEEPLEGGERGVVRSHVHLHTPDSKGDDDWKTRDGMCLTTLENWTQRRGRYLTERERLTTIRGKLRCEDDAAPDDDNRVDQPVVVGPTEFRAEVGIMAPFASP